MDAHPTKRFSQRVSYYIRSRPGYPAGLIDLLAEKVGLTPAHAVADVGSGTGLLTAVFLNNGNTVYGIEPNQEMREAGETFLGSRTNFHSINGSAEATTLSDTSVDLVVAGQAFHWFDPDKFAQECRRILKPDRWAALVWNERPHTASGFNAHYDAFVDEFTTDRKVAAIKGGSVGADAGMARVFTAGQYHSASLGNYQDLNWEGLLARVYSSSYMPMPNDPRADEMQVALRKIYDMFQHDGIVRLEYETRVFYGRLTS